MSDRRQAETREDLVEALFTDGFTTRDTATEVSGRGVGMAAVRAACSETGGRCQVFSELGQGTRFEFSWPLGVLRTEPDTCPTPASIGAAPAASGRSVTHQV
jgi:two-component system chemotaxis sensor kinase CheA